MFDFTLDMIAQAASNSLIIFCLCNLIIFTIIFGSSKPGSLYRRESEISMVINKYTYTTGKQGTSPLGLVDSAFISSTDTSKDWGVPIDDDDNGDNDDVETLGERDSDEDVADDDDYDDELRRRVEEFIEKVNRGWKEERMRTYQSLGTNN